MKKYKIRLLSFVFTSLLFSAPLVGQTLNDYRRHIDRYEGYSPNVYLCSVSNDLHVGPGLNIKWINSLKDYKLGESPPRELINREVTQIINAALVYNHTIYGFQNFNRLPREVKIILISLYYNLGERGIRNFRNFESSIKERDFQKAADHLKDSKWFTQVGNRGRDYFDTLKRVR
jgi:GH24 family phage-related lysozyme (muramidase)